MKWFKCKCKYRRRKPAKILAIENDTMKGTQELLASLLVTMGMDTTFHCFLKVGIVKHVRGIVVVDARSLVSIN